CAYPSLEAEEIDVSLCRLIAAPVVSSVSTPGRLSSIAKGLVIARSYVIAGKENVPGSSNLGAAPYPANHCIVCKSVLLAARNRWKSPLQMHTRRGETADRMPRSIRQSMLPI